MNKLHACIHIALLGLIAAFFYYYHEEKKELALIIEQQASTLTRLVEQQSAELENLRSSFSLSENRIQKNRIDIDAARASVTNLKKQSERLKLKSLTTERFALVSESGKELITMKSFPGRTFMMLKGEEGPNSIYLNVHDDGRKSISFRDNEAKAQIGIKTEENGMPEVSVWRGGQYVLRGQQGNHEVVKISEIDGRPEISFYDSVCNGPKIWTTNDWWLDEVASKETKAEPVDTVND